MLNQFVLLSFFFPHFNAGCSQKRWNEIKLWPSFNESIEVRHVLNVESRVFDSYKHTYIANTVVCFIKTTIILKVINKSYNIISYNNIEFTHFFVKSYFLPVRQAVHLCVNWFWIWMKFNIMFRAKAHYSADHSPSDIGPRANRDRYYSVDRSLIYLNISYVKVRYLRYCITYDIKLTIIAISWAKLLLYLFIIFNALS